MKELPKGWTVTKYFDILEIRDENGETKTWVPFPNNPMSMEELIHIGMQKIMEEEESVLKRQVLSFMHRNAESCRVAATDEINTTFLAELAAAKFNLDSALDNETHWIWELALEVAESSVHS